MVNKMKLPCSYTKMSECERAAVGGDGIPKDVEDWFDGFTNIRRVSTKAGNHVGVGNWFWENREFIHTYRGDKEGSSLDYECKTFEKTLTPAGKAVTAICVIGAIGGLGYLTYECFFDDD